MPVTGRHAVTVFRSRLRPGAEEDGYEAHAARIEALARTMPGFVSIDMFAGADGWRLAVVEFTSLAASEAWRKHPEHQRAQQMGRERYYSEYRLQVCELARESVFPEPGAEAPGE
jgi:heme-degrading monooxygenase HmoA